MIWYIYSYLWFVQAILFLYDRGFHQVGHVQTGNIFLDGDCCHLGGFENTIFGYKTRIIGLLTGNMESMDLVMFGKECDQIISIHTW